MFLVFLLIHLYVALKFLRNFSYNGFLLSKSIKKVQPELVLGVTEVEKA